MRVKTATGLIALYMRVCGFRGWASFWNTIYLAPGYETNVRLIRHEARHLRQIKEAGILFFTVKYLYWNCQYGYWNNPYEVEARAAESGD